MRNCRLVGSLNFGSYIWLNRGKGSFRLRIRQQRLAREPLGAIKKTTTDNNKQI
jgi:hypothetical protein